MKNPSTDHAEDESDEATHGYRDRLRQLLTATPRERRSVWSLSGSSTGSVKDDPNQDDSQSNEEVDASMDGYSEAGESQDMDTTAPGQLGDIGMVMTCVADLDGRVRSTEKSLRNQQSWNGDMRQDMETAQETIHNLKSTVALLEEKIRVLWLERSHGSANENQKAAPSTHQARSSRH
ncbi:hypothetical protein N7490_006681 [Penicillium lividum]|nr:hypothetical protein N7490_006681 [Penicillium lividum]